MFMDYFVTKYDIDRPPGAQSAVLEDSIMHKGHPVTAGSRIIGDFISPLDATVVTRLEDEGIPILGKTKMDEFGASALFFDQVSESGAVAAVADGVASLGLCNDYAGAVSLEAAAKGVCYIHPTYGTVSRYGVVHAVSSMDQVGIVSRTPSEGFHALSVIAGHDAKDGAMFRDSGSGKEDHAGRIRIGVPSNALASPQDASIIAEFVNDFEAVGFELPYYDVYVQVMQILCCAELSSNLTRYDGIKFGYRTPEYRDLLELYTKTRTEAFGADAKLASIIGSMVLSQEEYLRYYDKAMRIRRLIKESLDFNKYDAIVLPSRQDGAMRSEGALKQGGGSSDSLCGGHTGGPSPYAALPRLCGLPAVTVPYGGSGIILVADARREDILESALEVAGI